VGDGVVVGREIARQETEGGGLFGPLLDLSGREDTRGVPVKEQAQEEKSRPRRVSGA
jgi:hypothetical protein